jgi:hypothetical protein
VATEQLHVQLRTSQLAAASSPGMQGEWLPNFPLVAEKQLGGGYL